MLKRFDTPSCQQLLPRDIQEIQGHLTLTGTRGSRVILGIPNHNVRKQYYEFLPKEYQDHRHINLNDLMDLFDEMAYEGRWCSTLEFIAHAYKENSSVHSAMEGERNLQGFFTAYFSVNTYYLTSTEMEPTAIVTSS